MTPTQIIDLGLNSDGSAQIYQAVYEFPTEDALDVFAKDIEDNGYEDPTTDARPLTGYEVYVMKQLGKLLIFITFGILIP